MKFSKNKHDRLFNFRISSSIDVYPKNGNCGSFQMRIIRSDEVLPKRETI